MEIKDREGSETVGSDDLSRGGRSQKVTKLHNCKRTFHIEKQGFLINRSGFCRETPDPG